LHRNKISVVLIPLNFLRLGYKVPETKKIRR
jgi:hypothetical protein